MEVDAAGRPGPLAAMVREFNGVIPSYAVERFAYRIEQTPMRQKPGRKPASRDQYGATPRDAQLYASYETYHDLIESGASAKDAEIEARRCCKMSKEQFLELIRGGNSRVTPILRLRGTLRSKKSGVANISNAFSAP
ncbi:hypothetical protein G6321_00002680 (plasmid) [Bradyrhizobium barranii subsp. barranii]|uniref:Uncharacterized protein n=1 Tax=Bradyrhizobium barranii subsp. barranii TaxID=2823807 RepID=A0A7Z0QLV5_9BRAD|nr:hypothetical protein [Bradyrhizobium barranii]UGX89854.1 hypothetical protein G6321_00002680 [Bradyrhizobium barranii subsp. barranii]